MLMWIRLAVRLVNGKPPIATSSSDFSVVSDHNRSMLSAARRSFLMDLRLQLQPILFLCLTLTLMGQYHHGDTWHAILSTLARHGRLFTGERLCDGNRRIPSHLLSHIDSVNGDVWGWKRAVLPEQFEPAKRVGASVQVFGNRIYLSGGSNTAGVPPTSPVVSALLDSANGEPVSWTISSLPTQQNLGNSSLELFGRKYLFSESGGLTRMGKINKGGGDVLPFTSGGGGTSLSVSAKGFKLIPGQQYFVSVKSRNAAGLYSEVGQSDGIIFRPDQWCGQDCPK